GMFIAALLLLVLGYWACAGARKIGLALIVGGVLVGLAQVFPMLQVVAGMVGMGIGRAAGQVEAGHEGLPGNVSSEVGGFIVTLSTGGLLMIASVILGVLLRMMTPKRWWGDHAEDPFQKTSK